MRTPLPTMPALAAALLLATACEGAVDPEVFGSSEFSVTGDVMRVVRGDAFFEEVQTEGGVTLWFLHVQQGPLGSIQSVDFVRRGSRPGDGSIELEPVGRPADLSPGRVAAFIRLPPRDGSAAFESRQATGSLRLTRSDPDAMEGSFAMEATGTVTSPDGTQRQGEVSASGRFDAVRVILLRAVGKEPWKEP